LPKVIKKNPEKQAGSKPLLYPYQVSEVSIFPSGPYPWGPSYCTASDHTPGGGTDFLLFDGQIGTGFHTAWEQAAHLQPTRGASYCFKASFLQVFLRKISLVWKSPAVAAGLNKHTYN
jgi:hypothetical protein